MRRDVSPLCVVDHDDERRVRCAEHGLDGGTEQPSAIGERTTPTRGA